MAFKEKETFASEKMTTYKANESPYKKIDAISTGLPQLDRITGIYGIPSRRITEITGPFSIGKTTLSFNIIKEAQEKGLKTLFADVEWSFSEAHAEMCGVNLSKLDLLQSRFAEDCLDEIEEYISKHKNALVVIDSIGGLHPRAEGEKTMDGKVMGGQASLVSKFCRKVVPLLAMNNVALVVLNHEFVDIMTGQQMTSGGAKLAFHKSLWIKLKPKSGVILKDGDRRVGEVIIAQIRKNKMGGLRHAECEVQMVYGSGFRADLDVLRDALDKNIITKSGNSFYFRSEKLAVGLPKLRKYFEEHPDFVAQIKAQIG